MNEQVKAIEPEKGAAGTQRADKPAARQQNAKKVISNPREVAAAVMAQMHMVNSRKDELTIAIKGLSDMTQQLTQAYATQLQVIQQLTLRIKALEEKVGVDGGKPTGKKTGENA